MQVRRISIISLIISIIGVAHISAQDYDDIYYDASTDEDNNITIIQEEVKEDTPQQIIIQDYDSDEYEEPEIKVESEPEIINGRDVDEYNRRYTGDTQNSSVKDDEYYVKDDDDDDDNDSKTVISADKVIKANTVIIAGDDDDDDDLDFDDYEDYKYTKKIRAFYNPVVIIDNDSFLEGLALGTLAALTPSYWIPYYNFTYYRPSFYYRYSYSYWNPWFGPSYWDPWYSVWDPFWGWGYPGYYYHHCGYYP